MTRMLAIAALVGCGCGPRMPISPRPGDPCDGAEIFSCTAPQVGVRCTEGAWTSERCADCADGASCLACGCASSISLSGKRCDPNKDGSVCEVNGKITTCSTLSTAKDPLWLQYPCNACRAGMPLTCGNPSNGVCSCD